MATGTTVNLAPLTNAINQLANQQAHLSGQVGTLAESQQETRSELAQLASVVQEFVERDRMEKALALAETRLIKVRQELERSFGHYGVVRQSATGILQAFDSGLVTDTTVRGVTEEMMITTPRYWLAPVLVALAAWSRDERELAERAMDEALRRDVDKTALFFMLVMRRFEREAAATRWLEQFLARQDPSALGREFVIILEAVANGAFGPSAKGVAATSIDRWLAELGQREGFSDAQVARWLKEMERMATAEPAASYPTLSSWSPSWDRIAVNLGRVKAHATIATYFRKVFQGEVTLPVDLQHRVDDLLCNLVTSFDAEELPLRQQEAGLQAVVDANGDDRAARQKVATQTGAHDERVAFPTLLTNAAMHPKEASVTKGTQRLAIALSKDWIVSAHQRFTAEARQAELVDVPITFQTWNGVVRSGGDKDALTRSLKAHVDKETAEAVAKVRFTGYPLAAAIGAVVLLVVGLATLSIFVILLALGAGGYAMWGYRHLDTVRNRIKADGETRKKMGADGIGSLCAELVDMRKAWKAADNQAEPTNEVLKAFNPAEHALTSPGKRPEVIR